MSQFDVKKESRVFRPNSFPDCPLVPLLTAPELGHTALSFMHGRISLHSSLVLATQDIIHHKFNPCATIGSITCSEEKINQNIISCWLSYAQSLSSRYQCRKFHLPLRQHFSGNFEGIICVIPKLSVNFYAQHRLKHCHCCTGTALSQNRKPCLEGTGERG